MNKRELTRGIKICICAVVFLCGALCAQESDNGVEDIVVSPFAKANVTKLFKPFVVMEAWGTYSMGEVEEGKEYANRSDILFRRLRFGGSGTPYSWLKYSFMIHYDLLGEDNYSLVNGTDKGIGLWNAYISAKLLKNSELLNLHVGYYWAVVSRESNTAPWAVSSFDKVRADWYLRNFVAGKGNGIESGIGLGGIKNWDKFGVSYRIGTYEPQAYISNKYSDRLYTGRVMLSVGDAEQSTYKFMLSGNQWRKRNGVTLGFGGSTQINGKLNDSTFFTSSTSYGADLLINYGGLRVDGEYYLFSRKSLNIEDFNGASWHVRVAYSLIIANKYIEPTICYDSYEGKGDKSLYKYIGSDNNFDVGVNWYVNKDNLKLSLHYIIQEGYTSINTGNVIGVACQLKI